MSKIMELAIENLINRIETIEREVTELKEKSNYTPNQASKEQLNLLKSLGINIPNITKHEAQVLIQEELKNKKSKPAPIKSPSVDSKSFDEDGAYF